MAYIIQITHLTLADNTDQNVQPNSTLACNEL